jgi:hypothetical protein
MLSFLQDEWPGLKQRGFGGKIRFLGFSGESAPATVLRRRRLALLLVSIWFLQECGGFCIYGKYIIK